MANKDGEKETEHPKTILELMDNTRTSVEAYAQTKKISTVEAALILILNELRCMHWHYDQGMVKQSNVTTKKAAK